VVLAAILLGAGTLPAWADDPTPTPTSSAVVTPPPIPAPSDMPSPGPTYLITPGVGGSELPAPSDKKAVENAMKADRGRAKHSAGKAGVTAHHGHAGTKAGTGLTEVAGPQTPLAVPAVSPEKAGPLLRGFAALVAALVLFEITAVRRYVFRRRRVAVTVG
jgi:hypothetical protein